MSLTFDTVSPIDGAVLATTGYASDKEVESALNKTVTGQKAWRESPVAERAILCQKALEYFDLNRAEIGREITLQMGRPIQYAPGEVSGLIERGRCMIEIAPSQLEDIAIEKKSGFTRFIRRDPVGAVLVLAPWNYPYLTAINTIIPALMAGNSVVLKHSGQTPLCARRFVEAFKYAGLPEGVFQSLHLNHSQSAALIKQPQINYVAFTGSVPGGAAIEAAASGRFIGVGLELGGKDPAYVRADADLEFAVENLVDGAFFNSGQSCCGIERIYVEKSLYSKFVDAYVSLTEKYVLGNPLDSATTLGPVVSASAAKQVEAQVLSASQKGARLCIEESSFKSANEGLGDCYLMPQVLVNVDHNMEFMREETFGPVVGIMSVDGDEEALQLMNDSPYGLTASLWTNDEDAAIQLGNRIETGTVFQNRCDYLDPALVWTGVKNTGRGATLSQLGYQALTQPKSFHLRTAIEK